MAIRKLYLAGAALIAVATIAGVQTQGRAAAEAPKVNVAHKPRVQTAPIQVYLLAGQSNMVGYGLLDQLTTAEKTPVANIKVYGNDWVQKNALDPLDDSAGQIDLVSKDDLFRVGPGLFFARSMIASGAAPGVVLIPCAKGATSITQWAPGGGRDTLYGSCLARAKMYNGNYPIAGILWYQGEADSRTQAGVTNWTNNFRNMITAFRTDLKRPNLPVVFVGLGDKARDPAKAAPYIYWDQMQANQATFSMPCTAHVSAKGLAQNSDELHIATAGHRILGPRMATAMRNLRQTCL